jgi:hypothetical protein
MKNNTQIKVQNSILKRVFIPSLAIIMIIMVMSCSFTPTSSEDGSLQQTQMELSIQQTMMAQKATQDYMSQQGQQVDLGLQATQTALAAQNLLAQQAMQATETAVAAAQAAQPQPQETQPPDVAATEEPAPPDEDFETYKDNAKILLFEDMVNFPGVRRYVKDALDNLGLDYKDDGSAKGWLKSDMLGGNWDLVILSLEVRSNVSGEYFTYINQALDSGSAVILEIWYMDQISRGEISKTLSRCGVEFEKDYWGKTGTANDYIQWPLPGKSGHPILNEPNSGISYTNVAAFWLGDLGDFMKLSGKKDDAELLLGTIATEKNSHGTMVVCNNGKFIIQTFSSHDYAMEESVPLWENYIHNALKAKHLNP